MKKYIKPEIEVTKFDIEDIITISGGTVTEVAPKETVGGIEAADYGAQDFDIFK